MKLKRADIIATGQLTAGALLWRVWRNCVAVMCVRVPAERSGNSNRLRLNLLIVLDLSFLKCRLDVIVVFAATDVNEGYSRERESSSSGLSLGKITGFLEIEVGSPYLPESLELFID